MADLYLADTSLQHSFSREHLFAIYMYTNGGLNINNSKSFLQLVSLLCENLYNFMYIF